MLCSIVAASAVPVAAQVDVNYQAVSDITVPEPSTSRNLAMAGAGLAMGDDLSAAVLNPATLSQLVRGEITTDFTYPSIDVPIITGGTITRPSFGALPAAPGPMDITDHRLANSVDGPSYFAFAYPTRRFTAAGYWRYVELGTPYPTGITEIATGNPPTRFTVQPVLATAAFSGGNDVGLGSAGVSRIELGVAVAVPIGAHLSAGFAAAGEGIDVSTVTQVGTGGRVVPAGFVVGVRTADNRRYEAAFTIGGAWQGGRVHLGVAHHHGSSHEITTSINTAGGGGTIATISAQTSVFHTPDWTGGGVGVRVSETLRVVADVRRVAYSQTTAGLAALIVQPAAAFRTADATEVRAGGEYVIPFQSAALRSFALRGGVWRDPSHALVYVGADPLTGSLLGALFTDRIGDRIHGTGGFGLTINRFEFNIAADIADRYRNISGSVVVRFK
jgi:hypothetical protein